MYTSQKCSIHTPLQNYASIPFIHIEPKQSNKPEVKYNKESYYKREADRPKDKQLTKQTAEAKVP